MSDPPDKRDSASGEMSPQERAHFANRISRLDDRLDKLRSERQKDDGHDDASADRRRQGIAYGMRMAADLVAAVIVGSIVGWGLDWVLGSRPWMFLLFFLLGFAAGVLNVVRSYERMQKELAPTPGKSIGPAAPDDNDD